MDERKPPDPSAEYSGQGSENTEITLEQITKDCLDSPGYVLFAGVISRNRDKQGFNLINFNYRRYNFSFEDTKSAVEEFRKAYLKNKAEDES